MRLVRLLPAVLLAAVAGVPGAQAAGNACAASAAVIDGDVHRVVLETGEPAPEPSVTLQRKPGHRYKAGEEGAVVRFQKVRFELEPGAEVLLGCWGESKADGARFPRLALGEGTLRIVSPAGTPGAVSNASGFAHAQSRAAMTITATASDVFDLTVRKDRSKPGRIQVTPFAGPQKGTCRYVVGSASLDKERDRATYDGRRA